MSYLAIDPGVKAVGLALRLDGRPNGLIGTAHHPIGSFDLRDSILRAHHIGCTHAVIEQANGFGQNVKAAFGLCEARGRLIEACERTGLVVIRLHVATWQAGMLGKDRKGRTKELSIMSAKSLGVEIDNDNEADAVNMLVYAELNDLAELEDEK